MSSLLSSLLSSSMTANILLLFKCLTSYPFLPKHVPRLLPRMRPLEQQQLGLLPKSKENDVLSPSLLRRHAAGNENVCQSLAFLLPFFLQRSSTLFFSNGSRAENIGAFHKREGSGKSRMDDERLPSMSNVVGIVFDMDGTIVKPCIDFSEMRRRIHELDDALPTNGNCILQFISTLSRQKQQRANHILDEIERNAVQKMEFMDGHLELCQFLDSVNIKRAIWTRNTSISVDAMHHRTLSSTVQLLPPFHPTIARDTRTNNDTQLIPAKPAPDGILHICSLWNCHPSQVIMVGDSAEHDIVAASRAKCGGSVLLSQDSTLLFEGEQQPSVVVSGLPQLLEILIQKVEQHQ